MSSMRQIPGPFAGALGGGWFRQDNEPDPGSGCDGCCGWTAFHCLLGAMQGLHEQHAEGLRTIGRCSWWTSPSGARA